MTTLLCKGCEVKKDILQFTVYARKDGKVYQRKTCKKCRNRIVYPEARKKSHEKAKKRYKKQKANLVELMGGKCTICKQTYHPTCFDFHHINREDKKATIAVLIQNKSRYDEMIEELKKCILVCSNCHRVIHFGGD